MVKYTKVRMAFALIILPSLLIFSEPAAAKKRRPSPINVSGIIDAIMKTYGVNMEQLETAKNQSSELARSYKIYEEQLKNLQESKSALTGKNNYGLKDFKTYTSTWSNSANNMNELLAAYKANDGLVASVAATREQEFPLDLEIMSNSKFNKRDSDYHKLSAKTALSTRSASETEFNRIEGKIKDQEQLQKSIDNSQTLKHSVDLLVRMQAEGNKIMLENLRMLSILTQQAAISEQERVNARIQSARFLNN